MPTTTTTPASTAKVDTVIEAMRSIQTEQDRWHLAEALLARIPSGTSGFEAIIDAAVAAGVSNGLKPTTLRLYRDTAVRWPSDQRVPNVSFSAHREAMVAKGGTAGAVKMLTDLSKTHGPEKVTVASVRRAIAVQQGKPVPSAKAAAKAKAVDIVADLVAGAPVMIAAITTTTDLDAVHAGLTKAISHTERLRAKAAAKAKAAKATKAPAAKKAASTTPKKASARKSTGDLRGL